MRLATGLPIYFMGCCLALGLDTALLLLGRHLGMTLFWAATLGFVSGSLVSYAVSSRLAYSLRAARGEAGSFLAFTALGLLGLALTQFSLHGLTAAGWPLLMAKVLAAAMSFTCTFLLRRQVLFTAKATGT